MATAIKSKRVKEEGGLFRILVGIHLGKGPEGCECPNCEQTVEIKGVPVRGTNHIYRARSPLDPPEYDGDLIQSDVDMEQRHNRGAGSRKFERVHEGQAAVAQPPAPFPLDKMTIPQLIAVAEEEEIDLKGASKKDDILRILKTAQAAKPVATELDE
jgi:hypothetical protein